MCQPVCVSLSSRPSGGEERREGESGGATRLACKPIKVELHTTTFTFGISAHLHAVKEVQGM